MSNSYYASVEGETNPDSTLIAKKCLDSKIRRIAGLTCKFDIERPTIMLVETVLFTCLIDLGLETVEIVELFPCILLLNFLF